MRIGFIGAGKAGFSFGKYLSQKKTELSGYYSKNPDSAREAAVFTGSAFYKRLEELVKDSDVIILSVPDGKIHEVYMQIRPWIRGKYLCHLSGALSSAVFEDIEDYGGYGYSIHPICAICDKYESYKDFYRICFTIEGEKNTEWLETWMASLGNPFRRIRAEDKVKYHMSAVFASNLVTGLYAKAMELLQQCGLDEAFSEKALLPLFLGNARNIEKTGIIDSLTGPVERGDVGTIRKHMAAADRDTREIYRLLSMELGKIARRKHPDSDTEEMMKQLRNC